MSPNRDPEVRQITLAYARAIAVAERLASELDNTVSDLNQYLRETTDSDESVAGTVEKNLTVSKNDEDVL